MLDVTACLAVDIRYLPPSLEFTNTPQKSRTSLTIDDLLLSSEDGKVLVKRAVHEVRDGVPGDSLQGSGFHGQPRTSRRMSTSSAEVNSSTNENLDER